jgi:hypothetical protein
MSYQEERDQLGATAGWTMIGFIVLVIGLIIFI